jgi:hypothetical protein
MLEDAETLQNCCFGVNRHANGHKHKLVFTLPSVTPGPRIALASTTLPDPTFSACMVEPLSMLTLSSSWTEVPARCSMLSFKPIVARSPTTQFFPIRTGPVVDVILAKGWSTTFSPIDTGCVPTITALSEIIADGWIEHGGLGPATAEAWRRALLDAEDMMET